MAKDDIEVKKDCFAYEEKENKNTNVGPERICICKALDDLYCAKEKCKFYKTYAQYVEDNIKAESNAHNTYDN